MQVLDGLELKIDDAVTQRAQALRPGECSVEGRNKPSEGCTNSSTQRRAGLKGRVGYEEHSDGCDAIDTVEAIAF